MMSVWAALQASDLAIWIGFSRWLYAGVATAHVLSIAVLVGSILVLDLRLIGLARLIDVRRLAGLVVPVAAVALGSAVLSGALLFIGRAAEYAAFGTFQIKMALLAVAVTLTLVAHARYGAHLQRATPRQASRIGLASIALWLGIATAGRMIAYVHG